MSKVLQDHMDRGLSLGAGMVEHRTHDARREQEYSSVPRREQVVLLAGYKSRFWSHSLGGMTCELPSFTEYLTSS